MSPMAYVYLFEVFGRRNGPKPNNNAHLKTAPRGALPLSWRDRK